VRSDIFKDHNLYPFSGSIKEHFQAHFDAAFIALMPFTDKHLVELDMTVQESLKSVKPIGWSQVIEAVEFFGTKEVAKAFAEFLKGRSVKKSKSLSPDQEVLKVVKSLAEETIELKTAMTHILQGLGVADQIAKANEIQKSQNTKRFVPNDQNEIRKGLDYIKESLGIEKKNTTSYERENHVVSKGLADNDGKALFELFGNRK
jgi:hypothetical protein